MKGLILILVSLLIILTSFVYAKEMSQSIEQQCCMDVYKGEPLIFDKVVIDQKGERRIVSGFGIGGIGKDGEFQTAQHINITDYSECCNYVSNPNACYQCITGKIDERKAEETKGKIILYSSILFGILILICTFLLTRNKKEFYKFSKGKVILTILLGLTTLLGFFMMAMGSREGMGGLAFIILGWPFLFLDVSGLPNSNVAILFFIIIAFIIYLLYTYTISCLIFYLIWGRKNERL